MPAPEFTAALSGEYDHLFNTCEISDAHAEDVARIVNHILNFRSRYAAVETTAGVPWYVVAVIHALECGLCFDEHLHNGDPLNARTVQVPAGRPIKGKPPFDWAVSAADALEYDGFTTWKDWSAPGICYKLEGYNGWGYRQHGINTPYLWSDSNHYQSGKYIADDIWSDSAVSRQCGAAVILRRMAEKKQITLGAAAPAKKLPAPPALATLPAVPYDQHRPGNPQRLDAVEDLQRLLTLHPGVFLKVDGVAGAQTSDAFRQVTGKYLPGDPRAI